MAMKAGVGLGFIVVELTAARAVSVLGVTAIALVVVLWVTEGDGTVLV